MNFVPSISIMLFFMKNFLIYSFLKNFQTKNATSLTDRGQRSGEYTIWITDR